MYISPKNECFDETKYMSFLIKDDELLEKYNEIGKKLKIVSKNKLMVNLYKTKTKIKSYNGKINTNFHNNKIAKEGSQFICLSVILINFLFRTGKNYYSQVFLEKCKHVVKEKKVPEYITDDIKIFSEDSD